jgi:hypothetical protein
MYTHIETEWEMDDRGGGGIRGVVEKKLLSNTRRYRHAVLYFIQMQLTSLHFFPWGTYSLFSLTLTTTYLRSLCTRRRRPRVFTIICVEIMYIVYTVYGPASIVYYYTRCTYIREYIYIIIWTRIIRSSLKRFLDCFFAQHKFHAKTKRQTAYTDARKTNKKI